MNVILITGQNKKPILFKKNIDLFLKLNIPVVYVTWTNEIIPPYVKTEGSILLYQIPPVKKTYGNMLAQKTTFQYGLQKIKELFGDNSDNLFILKTRPDVYINESMLDYIFHLNMVTNDDGANGNLSHKIWIPWAHVIKPLYLPDESFYSHVSVLERLIVSDIYLFENEQKGTTPFRWYFPLVQNTTFIRDYLSLPLKVRQQFVDFKIEKNDKFICNILYEYYEFLLQNFHIYTKEGGIKFRKWSDPKSSGMSVIHRKQYNLTDISHTSYGPMRLKLIYNNNELKVLRESLL